MKRLYTAVLLLLLVIGVGRYNLRTVSGTVTEICSALEDASAAADSGNLSQSMQSLKDAHALYLDKEAYLSAVVNEKQLDEVRLGFARTEQSIQTGKPEDLTVEIAALEQAVDDLLRSEAISLKNIF